MVPGVYKNLPMEAYSRACFKETSLHISIAKVLHSLHSNFLTTFLQKNSIYPAKFPNDLFVTAQTAFHYCTFRFITSHFVHHCTLKQALRMKVVATIHLKMGSEIPPQSPQNYSHEFTQGAVHNVRHARWGGTREGVTVC